MPCPGPVVSGTAIALLLLASPTVHALSARMPTHWCVAAGLGSLALSMALLMVNLLTSSALLFASGVLLTALGHGMAMLAGMSMINRLATPSNRSGLLATYLVIGYLGSMVPMMGIGWIADHWGMTIAVSTFCTLVIIIATPAAVLFQRHPRIRPAPAA